HAEFAYTVMNIVAAGVGASDRFAALPEGIVGAAQVSRAADQLRHQRAVGVQRVLAGLAGGHLFHLLLAFADKGIGPVAEIRRQFTAQTALELARQRRV